MVVRLLVFEIPRGAASQLVPASQKRERQIELLVLRTQEPVIRQLLLQLEQRWSVHAATI